MATAKQMQKVMNEYATKTPRVFFVEIGAYDGKSNDPIFNLVRKFGWRGILVEPQQDQFNLLKENYSNIQGLHFENIAIADMDGPKSFYGIKATKYDNNTHGQLNSFNKDVVLKHRHIVDNLDSRLYETKVNCLTLTSLMNKYNVTRLNVLSIDTEGYDYEILKQINFNKIKPDLIHFEHKHLSIDEQDSCFTFLKSNGYQIMVGRYNSLAYNL